MPRLALTIVVLFLVFGSGVAVGIFFQRGVSATQEDAKKQADAAALAQAHVEVAAVVATMDEHPAPRVHKRSREEIIRALRQYADMMDDIEISRCPQDFQVAFQNASKSLRGCANYVELAPQRALGETVEVFSPLAAAFFSEGITLLGAGRVFVTASSAAKQAQEANAEEWHRVVSAFKKLQQASERYGVSM